MEDYDTSTLVIVTSLVSGLSGFLLGVYSIRGYLLSPELRSERHNYSHDPVESDESDVDEGDVVLDHAPNWTNSLEADSRQGLRNAEEKAGKKGGKKNKKDKKAKKSEDDAPAAEGEASPFVDAEKLVDDSDVPAKPINLDSNEECKLMLVVRTDLGMTKGKIAAQCSHATLACYETLSKFPSSSPQGRCLARWRRHGQAKVAVQVKSQEEMLALLKRARSLGLVAEVIQDAGRTQIEAGSLTVLGVGPAPKSAVDQVTGGLKLL